MGKVTFVVDPDFIDKEKIQRTLVRFKGLPHVDDYNRFDGPDRSVYVTDNPDSPFVTEGNRGLLKQNRVRVVTDQNGRRLDVQPNSENKYFGGLNQSLGKQLIWVDSGEHNGKPLINVFVHEVGHFKWLGYGIDENHDPEFYRMLTDVLDAMGLPWNRIADADDNDVSQVPNPMGVGIFGNIRKPGANR